MLLIKNGYIKTMAGKDIKNGCILVNDGGKIEKIAKNIEAPENAEIIDAEGRLVTPGCIDGHCHIGLKNETLLPANNDQNENVTPITPQLRAVDGLNPIDEAFGRALRRGVTTACTGPGSTNVIGGTFVAVKLYGNNVDKMIVKDPVAMKCAFGENPKKVYGDKKTSPVTRMAIAGLLRETLMKAKKYADEDEKGVKHTFDIKLEAMIPVMRGEIPLKAHAHQADDILTAIRIAKEFGVKLTIDHCTDGFMLTDEILESGYPVMLGPLINGSHKVELKNQSTETPAKIAKAGIPFCIVSDAPTVPVEFLPLSAGLAVRDGLDYDEAWRAITVNPARIIGIDERVGSLEKDKDADIVIWNADPIKTVGATSYKTIVDGKVVFSL